MEERERKERIRMTWSVLILVYLVAILGLAMLVCGMLLPPPGIIDQSVLDGYRDLLWFVTGSFFLHKTELRRRQGQ